MEQSEVTLAQPTANEARYAMRSAYSVLKELILYVRPPPGRLIELVEHQPARASDPNWIAGCGNMDTQLLRRFDEKVAELRNTDPQVDWSGVRRVGRERHIARWLSEVEGANS
jgi:hypothetical protein